MFIHLPAKDKLLREVSTNNDERLDAMLSELAAEQGIVPSEAQSEPKPPEEFAEYDEDIATEHQCPKCGYRFSGGQQVPVETES